MDVGRSNSLISRCSCVDHVKMALAPRRLVVTQPEGTQRLALPAAPHCSCRMGTREVTVSGCRWMGAPGTGAGHRVWRVRNMLPVVAAWVHSINPCRSYRKVLSELLIDDV